MVAKSRDKHLLHVHGGERTYKAKGLNHTQALELFSWLAFNYNEVDPS